MIELQLPRNMDEKIVIFTSFLDAPSHLYIRGRVRPTVGPSVRPSRVIFRRASCAVYPALFEESS